jgi:hypothetical protein
VQNENRLCVLAQPMREYFFWRGLLRAKAFPSEYSVFEGFLKILSGVNFKTGRKGQIS